MGIGSLLRFFRILDTEEAVPPPTSEPEVSDEPSPVYWIPDLPAIAQGLVTVRYQNGGSFNIDLTSVEAVNSNRVTNPDGTFYFSCKLYTHNNVFTVQTPDLDCLEKAWASARHGY